MTNPFGDNSNFPVYSSASIEWNNDVVLMLINMYRTREPLWNPTDQNYKNKLRKDELWNEIADTLNCDLNEIKKKMDSLLTSFRRERRRLESQIRSGETDVYKSSWFAFESMLFLMDKFGVKTDIKTEPQTDEPEHTPPDPQPFEMVTATHEPDVNIDEVPHEPRIIRRRGDFRSLRQSSMQRKRRPLIFRKFDPRLKTPFPHQPTPQAQPQPPQQPPPSATTSQPSQSQQMDNVVVDRTTFRDDCTIYGEFIASKLRRYSIHTRSIVEHLVSDILFNADMGEYEPSQYYQSPSQYYQSPSQSGEIITND